MRKCFYINGNSSADYNIFINNDTYLNSPQIDYTEYSIPAVNGSSVSYNKRFENVIRKFDCYIKKDVESSLNGLKKLLYSNPGYLRIESDYDPLTYQYGFLSQSIDVSPHQSGDALTIKFSLYFSCRPQKYLKATDEVSAEAGWSSAYYQYSVTRNSGFMQNIFSKIQIENVPNDLAFEVFNLHELNSPTASPFSSVSCSWSEGNSFACVVGASTEYSNEATNLNEVFVSTASSFSNVSFTPSQSEYIYLIVPVKLEGTFTYTYSEDGGTVKTLTIAHSNQLETVSSVATGVALDDITVTYSFNEFTEEPTTFRPNALYLATYANGNMTNEASVSIRFDKLSQEMIDTIWNGIGSEVNAHIDLVNYKAKLVGTRNTYVFDDYLEVVGNINGIADEIKGVLLQTAAYSAGEGLNVAVTPKWWVV